MNVCFGFHHFHSAKIKSKQITKTNQDKFAFARTTCPIARNWRYFEKQHSIVYHQHHLAIRLNHTPELKFDNVFLVKTVSTEELLNNKNKEENELEKQNRSKTRKLSISGFSSGWFLIMTLKKIIGLVRNVFPFPLHSVSIAHDSFSFSFCIHLNRFLIGFMTHRLF